MSAIEKSIPERVTKLEATMDAVLKGIDEIKQGMRDVKQEMREMRTELNARMDSWLRWILGFTFSSWITLMASIWLKR